MAGKLTHNTKKTVMNQKNAETDADFNNQNSIPEHKSEKKNSKGELSRKEIRRRRRIRNQTLAYSALIMVVGVVIFFGLWGTKQIMNGFKNNHYNINTGIEPENQANAEPDNTEVPEVTIETEESEQEEVYIRDELDDVVDAYLADMSLEEKVAQMFIITPESLTNIPGPATVAGAKTEAALNETAIGGVLFQSKNFSASDKTKEMVTKTYALGIRPLFTTAFEAGGGAGTISSVSAHGVTKTDNFATIGANQDTAAAYEAGAIIGTAMSNYGFTLNLSAVADLGTEESFGTDPALVSEMVSNYVLGVKSTGVNVCLTHFPGTSQIIGDSSKGMCYTEENIDEMRASDFLPFKAGIDAGAEFVMVGHVAASNITGDSTPASMSSVFITDLLRNELGFRGVVITDRMDYPAITEYWTTEEATLMAVNSGADIILCPDDFQVAYHALLSAVQNGTISEERINESLHRIYRVQLAGSAE